MSPFKIVIPENRVFGLDILRAIAICLVVYQHGFGLLPTNLPDYIRLRNLDGVTLFFVLSGFLIGGILFRLLENRKASWPLLLNFWQRRWLRTLPLYFIILLGFVPLYELSGLEIPYQKLPSYFSFTQNFLHPHPKFFVVAWSLSVEEWFYLIVPTAMFLLAYWRRKDLSSNSLLLIVAVIVASMLIRFFRFEEIGEISQRGWSQMFRMQVITRLDSIQIGVLGAWLYHYRQMMWLKKPVLWLFLGGLFLLINTALKTLGWVDWGGYYACVLSFPLESLATLALFPYFTSLKKGSGLFYRGVTAVSLVSYSMYLIHNTIVIPLIISPLDWSQIIPVPNLNIVVKYGVYWVLTMALSVLSYKYIELPFMRLRPKSPH